MFKIGVKANPSSIFFTILRFWEANKGPEYILYFQKLTQQTNDILEIYKDEIKSCKELKTIIGVNQLWWYLGSKITILCRIRFITKEVGMLNDSMKNFIRELMKSLNRNVEDINLIITKDLNSKIIEKDRWELKLMKSIRNKDVKKGSDPNRRYWNALE